jgi:hypothetical protein
MSEIIFDFWLGELIWHHLYNRSLSLQVSFPIFWVSLSSRVNSTRKFNPVKMPQGIIPAPCCAMMHLYATGVSSLPQCDSKEQPA